jgi:hypothetical protein
MHESWDGNDDNCVANAMPPGEAGKRLRIKETGDDGRRHIGV